MVFLVVSSAFNKSFIHFHKSIPYSRHFLGINFPVIVNQYFLWKWNIDFEIELSKKGYSQIQKHIFCRDETGKEFKIILGRDDLASLQMPPSMPWVIISFGTLNSASYSIQD